MRYGLQPGGGRNPVEEVKSSQVCGVLLLKCDVHSARHIARSLQRQNKSS